MADEIQDGAGSSRLRLAARITAAFVSHNQVAAAALPALVAQVHQAIAALDGQPAPAPAARRKPAVPIRSSVHHDFIVCLEDGKRLKVLKRYLRARYGMSPDEYRRRWALPPEYPMVAPAYAALRSDFARKIGLGRSRAPTA